MRKVVIAGAPPVQILDVSGPLEVFSKAPGYEVQIGNPGPDRCLQTNRGVSLTGAAPIEEINGPIDTLIITGGPGAETSVYDESFISWIVATAARWPDSHPASANIASPCHRAMTCCLTAAWGPRIWLSRSCSARISIVLCGILPFLFSSPLGSCLPPRCRILRRPRKFSPRQGCSHLLGAEQNDGVIQSPLCLLVGAKKGRSDRIGKRTKIFNLSVIGSEWSRLRGD